MIVINMVLMLVFIVLGLVHHDALMFITAGLFAIAASLSYLTFAVSRIKLVCKRDMPMFGEYIEDDET